MIKCDRKNENLSDQVEGCGDSGWVTHKENQQLLQIFSQWDGLDEISGQINRFIDKLIDKYREVE